MTHPHAAGEAFAAGLVLAEGDQAPGQVNNAGIFIGGDDAPGTQDSSSVAKYLKVQHQVNVVNPQNAA
jgi:hypothetical protein